MEKLNVLDEEGNVIGQEYHDVIHQKGLLHAEVHVWCVTPSNELIFQHRAKDKDTYPDLLDATAGGHVDLGETYEEAAVKELLEETGIEASADEFVFLKTEIRNSLDPVTNMTNHPRRNIYLLKRKVAVDDLVVEEGKALGFVAVPFADLYNLNETEQQRYIPTLIDSDGIDLLKEIENKI